MQIILDPEESKAYQDQKVREAILAETSKFPVKFELPEGCKLRTRPLTADRKATIMEMYADGMKPRDIARELGLPGRQVSGIIQGNLHPIAANVQAAVDRESVKMHVELHQEPKIEGLQPMQPLIMPEAEKPPIEPTCTACGKQLGHDKVAIDGKMYCGPKCAPKKVPTMITKRPKPAKKSTTHQERVDEIILRMSKDGERYSSIAAEICNQMGGVWLPDDVGKRLKELRT
ncbi:helix-turn-helix domain-containing protein [Candidatus Pacearchaeota archaeon]|jgi:hypothetical protein|nr:helix-turn-helix domain-containing protein [Candidatus Pacearchaeota archaeon]